MKEQDTRDRPTHGLSVLQMEAYQAHDMGQMVRDTAGVGGVVSLDRFCKLVFKAGWEAAIRHAPPQHPDEATRVLPPAQLPLQPETASDVPVPVAGQIWVNPNDGRLNRVIGNIGAHYVQFSIRQVECMDTRQDFEAWARRTGARPVVQGGVATA